MSRLLRLSFVLIVALHALVASARLGQLLPPLLPPGSWGPRSASANGADPLFSLDNWPLPNKVTGNATGWGGIHVHDPSIIFYNGWYWSFTSHDKLAIGKSRNLSGPWEHAGSVLSGPSIIKLRGRFDPWAPDVSIVGDKIYCYYAVSNYFGKVSAIGLATSPSKGDSFSWTDHGAIFQSGEVTAKIPYNETNAIDPNLFIDPNTKLAWLQYGSFFSDIWQLPLTSTLDDIANTTQPVHLSRDGILEEGSYMSFRNGWYYLWFNRGKCCFYTSSLPRPGNESANGPFVDRYGTDLRDGGGHLVFGSHKNIYGPGGQGMIDYNGHEVLYYHYFDTELGLADKLALLGWNYLAYEDGWPSLVSNPSNATSSHSIASANSTASSGSATFDRTVSSSAIIFSIVVTITVFLLV